MSGLHSQAVCLYWGVAKMTTSSSQLPSHQPSRLPPIAESLPTRCTQNPSTGPHWPILGHMSIPQPIISSKRMGGSAWPHPGPTPPQCCRLGSVPPSTHYGSVWGRPGPAAAATAAKSLQSCLTLCDPIDGSPPGSPVPGILQARTPEWVAISFSSEWKWKVKGKSLSHVRLLATPWTAAHQAPPSMGFSRQEYWSGVPLPSPIILAYCIIIFILVISTWMIPFMISKIFIPQEKKKKA